MYFFQQDPLFIGFLDFLFQLSFPFWEAPLAFHPIPKFNLLKSWLFIDFQPANTSLFQSLILCFNSFSLVASLKLAFPLTTTPYHQPRMRSLKPSTLIHIFSNLNGEGPLLSPPPSNIMGKWSEVGLGSLLWSLRVLLNPLKEMVIILLTL